MQNGAPRPTGEQVAPTNLLRIPHDSPDFWAELHPLERQFLAYRCGYLDGRDHTVDEAADRFGIDSAFARKIDEYLAARRRLHVSRAGWRAAAARYR